MAYDADKVVVELVANVDTFDAKVKQSATSFDSSMNKVAGSAKKAEDAVTHMTTEQYRAVQGIDAFARATGKLESANNAFGRSAAQAQNRMRLLGFQIGDIGTQLSSGTSPFIVLAQQGPQVANALDGASGAVGKFATFLSGPYGAAVLAATTLLGAFLLRHKEEGATVGDLVQKLKEHAEKTRDSEEADRIWAGTLDGLIERQKRLNEELGKRLTTQAAFDANQLTEAQTALDQKTAELRREEQNLSDLQARREQLRREAESPAVIGTPQEDAVRGLMAKVDQQIEASKTQIGKLQEAVNTASSNVARGMAVAGEAQADLNKLADHFSEIIRNNNKVLIDQNPTLAAYSKSLYGAGAALEKAMGEAASTGVGFSSIGVRAEQLQQQLSRGQITVKTYTTEIQKMAKALHDSAEAAKKLASQDPVKAFKASVIGAEGTGPNKLGSSAAGFGQFVPGTWLGYFNRLFPDKADLSDAAKLAYRNVRSVAEAVIDKATDDYVKVIQKAGQSVTAANLYAVHLLGSGDAAKFFAAAPGTQTSSFLSAAVLKGNPFLRGTKAQAAAAIAGRIGDSSGAVSSATTAMQDIAEKQVQSDLEFAKKSADLDAKIIAAKDGQVQDELAKADVAEERLRAEQEALDAQINADAMAKKNAGLDAATVDAQAKVLHEKVEQLTHEKIVTAELLRQTEIAKRVHEAEDQRRQFAIDDLKATEQLATSQQDRRRIELELLDLKYEQKAADLEYLKEQALRNGKLHDANMIQGQIDHLPYEKGTEAVGIEMSTMGPLQSFLKQIPGDADAANEALQSIAVDGIRSVVDGLGQASVAWIKMGGVAGQIIKSLISKIITLILYQQIAHLFGSKMPTNPFGDANPIVDLGDVNLTPLEHAPVDLPHLAGGGSGIIGGNGGTDNNLLSLNGKGVAWVNKGERLTISNDTAAAAGGGGGNIYAPISIYADDAVLAETVRGWVKEGMSVAIQGGSQSGAAMARNNLARKQLYALR
jgi:hypothetical protein